MTDLSLPFKNDWFKPLASKLWKEIEICQMDGQREDNSYPYGASGKI